MAEPFGAFDDRHFSVTSLDGAFVIYCRRLAEELEDGKLLLQEAGRIIDQNRTVLGSCEVARTGRGSIGVLTLTSDEGIVLRPCLRGGLMREILGRSYVRPLGQELPKGARPVREIGITYALWEAGVAVPEPVGAVVWPRLRSLVYSGVFACILIKGASNLLSHAYGERIKAEPDWTITRRAFRAAGVEAGRALAQGVWHRDLHPGNVLLDAEGKVYLIDFDRARIVRAAGLAEARQALSRRWGRSVRKHGLGEEACRLFDEGLRQER